MDCAPRRAYSPIDQLLREVETTAMHTTPHLLDVVALLSDLPSHGLVRGQVGTVVETLDGAYEVEFSDDEGKTWKWKTRLENVEPNKGSFSYPSLIQTKDGLLHITYSYHVEKDKKSIKYVVVNPQKIEVE